MSKSLRMLLLSMLVIAVAAMPAMAETFIWTGAVDNQWAKAGNWSGDVSGHYPGRADTSGDVFISKDANIEVAGGLSGVIGTITVNHAAKVAIDFTTTGRFGTMPSFDVVSGELKLTGTTQWPLRSAPTWAVRNNGKLTLNIPATLTSADNLTLSVDNGGKLTINDASLLNYTTIKASGSSATVVLNAQPATPTTATKLNINMQNSASLEVSSDDVTLYANRKSNGAVISGATFKKTGAKALTLIRTTSKDYDVVLASKDSAVKTINVAAGSLVLGSAMIAEASLDLTVASGATLDVSAANAIYTSDEVELTVIGTAEIADAGIGSAKSIYDSGNKLDLTPFNLSADVRSGGTLTFKGSQPVKNLRGAGTVEVSGTDAVLLVSGDAKSVSGFTGTLNASTVGLVADFDNMPFSEATSSNIAAINVYGGATLSLDAAALTDVTGMDELTVHLYSDYNAVDDTALSGSAVGNLNISGDVTLGTLIVDGTKSGVATVSFRNEGDVLTVNSLVLHANKGLDDPSLPTYSFVKAIAISGDGTFAPKAISNATSDNELGSEEAITVKNGATLKLVSDVPAGNSLVLNGATLDAANGVTIPEGLVLDNATTKVELTGDNMRMTGGGHNALNVAGTLELTGNVSFDITLNDDNQDKGNKYRIIGAADPNSASVSFGSLTSMDVTGIFAGGAITLKSDDYGVYGYLMQLALQPRLLLNGTALSDNDSWSVSAMPNGSDFEAKISYDIPANVEPARLINLISIDVKVNGESLAESNNLAKIIDDVVMLKALNVNSPDKEIVLTGKFYEAEKLETTVTLGWKKTSGDTLWATYEKAGILYKGQSVVSTDFKAANTITLVITNPYNTSDDTSGDTLSEDVIADPEEIVIDNETPEITAGSGDVVLTIEGIREAVPANTSSPVLINGVYIWQNGFDNTTKYEMLFEGNWILMESLDIQIDGVSINLDSVDISGSDPITVTIPAALFNTETIVPIFQDVTIVGTTANGHTLTAGPASVHIVPDYEERSVDEGKGDLVFTKKQLPQSLIIVDGITDLTGPFSFDLTVDGLTETPSWFTWNVNSADGTIAYEVAEGADAGTYNMRVIAYTAEGGYIYNFTLTITEGFKINGPDELYDPIAGLNYEAHFTAENAPEGAKIEWKFVSSDTTPEKFKAVVTSGDVFVVYGPLPSYVEDDEAETDPNEFSYTVTATVSGDTASKDWTVTVEEDTDATIAYDAFNAGKISGDISSADTNYSVTIAFDEEYYDTELEFNLPYWLVATPVMVTVDDEEVITGYTITYRQGAAVTAGDTGVVRFEDPASTNGEYVSWNVTFTQTVAPAPQPGSEFTLTTDATVTLTLGTATGATTTLTLSVDNAIGEIVPSYTVTPNNGGLTVSISGNQATLTGLLAGEYTVVFTVTDGGRPEGSNTATSTTTVTVSGGFLPPDGSRDFTLSTDATVTLTLGTATGATTTLTLATENASGDVSYSYTVTPTDGLTVEISDDDNTATLTGTAAGTYTIVFTATDSANRTASFTTTVTVTGGVIGFTLSTDATVTLTLGTATGATATLTLATENASGDVSYSYTVTPTDGLTVEISDDDNTATLTGTAAGTYTVVFTATDSANRTASFTTTVTVTGGISTFTLQRMVSSVSFDISATIVSYDINALVRPVNNQGTVSYRGTVSPTSGLDVSIDDGVVAFLATQRGTYTVTIIGTDSATSQTANTTITVVVSGRTGTLGSSGGGCDAGFGALALALAVPLFLRRRRS